MKCARTIPHSPPISHQNHKSLESMEFRIKAKHQRLLHIFSTDVLQKTRWWDVGSSGDTQLDRLQKYTEIIFRSVLNLLIFVCLGPVTWIVFAETRRGRAGGRGHPSFQAAGMKNTSWTQWYRIARRSFRKSDKSFSELLYQTSGIPLDSNSWANWIPHPFS